MFLSVYFHLKQRHKLNESPQVFWQNCSFNMDQLLILYTLFLTAHTGLVERNPIANTPAPIQHDTVSKVGDIAVRLVTAVAEHGEVKMDDVTKLVSTLFKEANAVENPHVSVLVH